VLPLGGLADGLEDEPARHDQAGTVYVDPLPGAHLDSTTLSVGAMVSGGVSVIIQTNMPTTVLDVAHALTQAGGAR
jgi:hypothetical protein